MKTFTPFILSFFALLLFSPAFSQIETEYLNGLAPFSKWNAGLSWGDKAYAVGSIYKCKGARINRFYNDPSSDWVRSAKGGYWEFDDMILQSQPDSLLLASGFYKRGDDYGSEDDKPYVIAYTLDGDQVFSTPLELLDPITSNNTNKTSLTINGDNDIVVAWKDVLYWLSADGNFFDTKVISNVNFLGLKLLNDSTMIALSENNLYWMNNDGAIQNTLNLPSWSIGFFVQGESIFVLTEEWLLKVDGPNTVSSDTTFTVQLDPKGITGTAEQIFIWGEDIQSEFSEILEIHKTLLTPMGMVRFEQENTEITNVVPTADNLLIYGVKDISIDEQYLELSTGFVKSINNFEAPSFVGEDLSLDYVTSLSHPFKRLEIVSMDGDSLFAHFSDSWLHEISVTNHGIDTITSFAFISEHTFQINCGEERVFKYYSDVLIPPGQSLTFRDSAVMYFGGSSTSHPFDKELSFVVYAPNNHFDEDFSNNTTTSKIAVGIREVNEKYTNQLKLYPNPAQDIITLKSLAEENFSNASISIFDVQGKKVFTPENQNWDNQKEWTLDISQLPNGFYFLSIRSGEKWAGKKFVVSR